MAEKKEGTDIPKTPKNNTERSNQLSFKTAAIDPINTPIKIAIKMELIAKTKVFGNVSLIIDTTDLSVFERSS